jgi:hypothetical protein
MRKIFTPILVAVFLWGCSTPDYSHEAGGPYYFNSGITYRGYRPTGELTKSEADELAKQGHAFYIAYFNSDGKPTRILKVYEGKTVLDQEIKYDANGVENGVGPNRAEQQD